MSSIQSKKIVLGITGSIAAYKAVSLARLLIKKGAEVQIVITPSGKEFITPVTLSAITSKPVISEFFISNDGTWNSHVDIGLWADLMIIAPTSASTLGKMAHGIADNMLITTYLSMKAPVMVAPAMDLDMFKHPSTSDNLATLQRRGNIIIEPKEGELASHLIGKGRMEEPEAIVDIIERHFSSQKDFAGKSVIITAGPTYEHIDPVRFIGNYSSGLMGISMANEFYRRGAEVTLILGPTSLKPHEGVKVINVHTAIEMYDAVNERIDGNDVAVFSAAVADYRPSEQYKEKIKREKKTVMTLSLVKNPDIAAEMGQKKKKHQLFIGFALETSSGENEAKRKLKEKNLDAIILNTLKDEGAGFSTKTNKITIMDRDNNVYPYPLKEKKEVAVDIVNFIVTRLKNS